jgi:hypothetical protein
MDDERWGWTDEEIDEHNAWTDARVEWEERRAAEREVEQHRADELMRGHEGHRAGVIGDELVCETCGDKAWRTVDDILTELPARLEAMTEALNRAARHLRGIERWTVEVRIGDTWHAWGQFFASEADAMAYYNKVRSLYEAAGAKEHRIVRENLKRSA